jgi:tetratricopeptide (TPR) repeat protein
LLDHGPPAPLYLALRAARRAIARNPDDANAYLLLGQIYSDLQNRTREGGYAPNELREIRLAQAVGALQQAVSLDPELAEAHNLLADQYRRLGYLDLTARHMREHLRCVQNAPPPAGLSAEDRAKALQQREDQIQSLEAVVKRREDDLLAKHNKLPAADKAALALRSDRDAGGLAITALDALKTIDFKELAEKDPAAARRAAFMQIDVLFLMGQLSDIREVVKGDETFDWYRIRLAAATGDYAEADEILEKLSKRAATLELDRGLVAGRLADLVARTATRATNMAGPLPALFDLAEMQARLQRASGPQMQIDIVAGLVEAYNRVPNQGLWFLAVRDMARESIVPVQQEVDLRVLRGWLALEAGDNKKALEELQTALSLRWQPRHFLPVLATLGAASPFEVMTSMFGGGSAVVPPLFDFNGRGLAVIGLQRLQAKKE